MVGNGKVGWAMVKGAITLKPPVIFCIKGGTNWMTCPPKLGLVESTIW